MDRPKSWLSIIAAAFRRQQEGVDPFTSQDIAEAADWATCAVGEHRSSRTEYIENGALPAFGQHSESSLSNAGNSTLGWWVKLNHHGPSFVDDPNELLSRYGLRFYHAVMDQAPIAALECYTQIHELWDKADDQTASKYNPRNPVTG